MKGQGSDYLQVDYALSGRAQCRGCEDKIDKEILRIAIVGYHSEKWYHPKCLDKIPKKIADSEYHEIQGIDVINKNDRQLIKDLVQNLISSQKKNKKVPKSTTQASQGNDFQNDDKLLQSASKRIKQSEQQNASSDSESSDQQMINSAAGYNDEEKMSFRACQKNLRIISVTHLKEMLQVNEQTQNGTKVDLVERVADGMTLGAIPRCQNCGGGRPRFNIKSGKYKCPGYMEDTDFKHCNKVFDRSQIERTKWQEI